MRVDQPNECRHDLSACRRHSCLGGSRDNGSVDGLNLCRSAGQHVLQHRGLVAAVVGYGMQDIA
jgi:hypothetical protein